MVNGARIPTALLAGVHIPPVRARLMTRLRARPKAANGARTAAGPRAAGVPPAAMGAR